MRTPIRSTTSSTPSPRFQNGESKSIFDKYLTRWSLTPDGEAIVTATSDLLPVLHAGQPAFLKIAKEEEERWGGQLMLWWDGKGAARVLAHDDSALLLERVSGKSSLVEMALTGRDHDASQILCEVANQLHAPRPDPPPELIPLGAWFRELEPAALRFGGIFLQAAATARQLLDEPRDTVVLHGDLHHQNVLDGGVRGWVAIDPKRLSGERAFDFANIFCNPNPEFAASPGRLAMRAATIAEAASLDRRRLLKWVLAYAGLSAAWSANTRDVDPAGALVIARIAAAELASST